MIQLHFVATLNICSFFEKFFSTGIQNELLTKSEIYSKLKAETTVLETAKPKADRKELPMKRTFPLILAAILLLTSCFAPDEDEIMEPSESTEQSDTYRPDLGWGKPDVIRQTTRWPVYFDYSSINHDKPIPCFVHVVYTGSGVKTFTLVPAGYFDSIGWEILPRDAWQYVEGAEAGDTIIVVPGGSKTIYHNDMTKHYNGIIEYYDLPPNTPLDIYLRQAQLKVQPE